MRAVAGIKYGLCYATNRVLHNALSLPVSIVADHSHCSALPSLAVEEFEEFGVVLGLTEAFDHDLGGVFDLLAGECAAEELSASE
ncbi:MAG: hypothetical protein ACI9JZ_000832 [Lentimonas sp.]